MKKPKTPIFEAPMPVKGGKKTKMPPPKKGKSSMKKEKM